MICSPVESIAPNMASSSTISTFILWFASSISSLFNRDVECKYTPLSLFTFYRDFSPMGFYDIFNECQSYAMSLYGILMGYTIELPEYQFLVFRSNTPSIIRNADNYISKVSHT